MSRGFFAGLSPRQQKAALAYRGDENHGNEQFKRREFMRPENFKDGDRVCHINRGELGTVKITDEGHVMVTFDNPTPRGAKSVGIYDYNWFEVYPDGLQQTPGA